MKKFCRLGRGVMDRFKDKKILIIDDDEPVRYTLQFLLERDGYRNVRCAVTGEEGLKMAREWKPAVIVSDIMHPGPDGFMIFEELFMDPATLSTRFILLSGCRPTEDIYRRMAAAGVALYIEKPTDLRKFTKVIDKILDEADKEAGKGL